MENGHASLVWKKGSREGRPGSCSSFLRLCSASVFAVQPVNRVSILATYVYGEYSNGLCRPGSISCIDSRCCLPILAEVNAKVPDNVRSTAAEDGQVATLRRKLATMETRFQAMVSHGFLNCAYVYHGSMHVVTWYVSYIVFNVNCMLS